MSKERQYLVSETLLEQIKDYVLNSHKWSVLNNKPEKECESINFALKYVKEKPSCKCS